MNIIGIYRAVLAKPCPQCSQHLKEKMSDCNSRSENEQCWDEFLDHVKAAGSNNCQFYADYGEQYDLFIREHFPWKLKELFANAFVTLQPNKNIRILDVGCGTGLFGQELLKRGYVNIDGLDGSKALNQLSLKKGVTYNNFYEFRVTENADLPMESRIYDVVLGADVVYKNHISMKAFEKITRVIKPGGLLGWSHIIRCKAPETNPNPEDYEYLEKLIERSWYNRFQAIFRKQCKAFRLNMSSECGSFKFSNLPNGRLLCPSRSSHNEISNICKEQ